MRIGDREIGPHADVYIIAELGVNHDGSVDRALQLTDAAADAGADAIKLQLFKTDLLMSKAAKLAAYQKAAGETDPIAMLRRLELSVADMARVVERAHARGLHAIVTVFSVELVAEAETLAWDAYKTASPDITNKPLLDALAATGKPLIVSTGASTLAEVGRTIRWLDGVRDRLAILQCVSSYPVPLDQNGLTGIAALRRIFDGQVGYSDHTTDWRTGMAAASIGATVLEKHLTYDVKAAGPDHAASVDPGWFGLYVQQVREWTRGERQIHQEVESLRGSGDPMQVQLADEVEREYQRMRTFHPGVREGRVEKLVLPIEEDVRRVSRQSLVAKRFLPADHRITRADLTIKRPGTGIAPWRLDEVIGRQTARTIEGDVPLVEDDLA